MEAMPHHRFGAPVKLRCPGWHQRHRCCRAESSRWTGVHVPCLPTHSRIQPSTFAVFCRTIVCVSACDLILPVWVVGGAVHVYNRLQINTSRVSVNVSMRSISITATQLCLVLVRVSCFHVKYIRCAARMALRHARTHAAAARASDDERKAWVDKWLPKACTAG